MIVKVPIYVELVDISQDLLPTIVDLLGKRFELIIRKEDFVKNADFIGFPRDVKGNLTKAKVLTKEKAFEALRVAK